MLKIDAFARLPGVGFSFVLVDRVQLSRGTLFCKYSSDIFGGITLDMQWAELGTFTYK